MGTLSPEDERRLLMGCITVLVFGVLLIALIAVGLYELAQWVWGFI